MRIIFALAAVASLAACSHSSPEAQPGPETGAVSPDTARTHTPPGHTPPGTVDTTAARPGTGTSTSSASPPPPADTMPMHRDSV
jgi:uncharacterized lipoprotein